MAGIETWAGSETVAANSQDTFEHPSSAPKPTPEQRQVLEWLDGGLISFEKAELALDLLAEQELV